MTPSATNVACNREVLCNLAAQGVANRDIKLENILLDDSEPRPLIKICDFGYSKVNAAAMLSAAGLLCLLASEGMPSLVEAPAELPTERELALQQFFTVLFLLRNLNAIAREICSCANLLDGAPQHEFFQSAPGSRVGTPAYLAPEIILTTKGRTYDAKARAPLIIARGQQRACPGYRAATAPQPLMSVPVHRA